MNSLWSIDDVAKYFKVNKFTVYRLVSQRKLPAFKVGWQWRFKKETIDAWLNKQSNLSRRKSRS